MIWSTGIATFIIRFNNNVQLLNENVKSTTEEASPDKLKYAMWFQTKYVLHGFVNFRS